MQFSHFHCGYVLFYFLIVVTALVPRKTSDAKSIHEVPEDFVSSQFHAINNEIGVDALKIGMNSYFMTYLRSEFTCFHFI
jgi:hydroxymethylpyrimidine/phosphomethylpyrimidine kinase